MSQRPAAARRAPGSLSAGAAVARSEGGESAGPRKGAPARAQPGTLARAGRLVADRGRRGLRWTGALSAGGSRALRALALWLALAGAAAAQDLAPCPPGQPPLRLDPAVTASLGARILAIGSSSTSGAGASGPAANYPAQLQARLGGGARVDNAGRGGERAAATLARLRTRLAAEPYDLVIWQVGVNDALGTVDPAAFAATLDAGVATIRAAGATPMLMDQQAFPGMRDPARYARFVALVGAAARRHGVALVPRHAIMAGWDAATLETMLAADRFHMGDRGYGCLAALLAEALSG